MQNLQEWVQCFACNHADSHLKLCPTIVFRFSSRTPSSGCVHFVSWSCPQACVRMASTTSSWTLSSPCCPGMTPRFHRYLSIFLLPPPPPPHFPPPPPTPIPTPTPMPSWILCETDLNYFIVDLAVTMLSWHDTTIPQVPIHLSLPNPCLPTRMVITDSYVI